MAVDESSSGCGVAIFVGTELIRYCSIIPDKKIKKAEDKLEYICNELKSISKQYKPTVFVAEDVYSRGAKFILSFKYNVFLQGYIYALSGYRKDNLFFLYYPEGWRKILGISGKNRDDKKVKDIAYVNEKYHLKLKDDNIADAICIGDAYIKDMMSLADEAKKYSMEE